MVKVHWGIFAKYDIDPDVFYFADTVHTIFAEPDQIGKEFQIEFVFFCIGDEAKRISLSSKT